ncbi:MAG: hypothetical protein ACP5UH_03620 [Candidatus Micrarchaeia archaeon]
MVYETRALSLSLATVALTILAIIIFIYQRGSAAFYATVVIAIIVGFANAWLLGRSAGAGQSMPKAPKSTGTSKAGARRASRPSANHQKR